MSHVTFKRHDFPSLYLTVVNSPTAKSSFIEGFGAISFPQMYC